MNTKQVYHFFASAAIAMIMTVGPVAAQDQDTNTENEVPRFIQRFDQDGDDKVSLTEFTEGMPTAKERFQLLDENGDGLIDAEEAPGRYYKGKKNKGKMLDRFDADGDGTLSMEEFPGSDDRFEALDTDGDGALTIEEMKECKRRHGRKGKGTANE